MKKTTYTLSDISVQATNRPSVRFALLVLWAGWHTACGSGGGRDAAASGGTERDTIEVLAEELGRDICDCYKNLAEAVRVSQLPHFRGLSTEDRVRHGERVDSLSQEARLCFSNAKIDRHIPEMRLQWNEEQKTEMEERLAGNIERLCPPVATLLSGGNFY